MPRMKKTISTTKPNDPYKKYGLKNIAESGLSKEDLLIALKDLVDLVKNETNEKRSFYPEEGTAFCDKSLSPAQLSIVESKDNLSAIFDHNDGHVAFFNQENGSGDFSNWVQSIREGLIEIIWCPVHGRILNNDHYIELWGL